MSGHSHWKTVKRTKEAEDKKRAKIFSKLAREISLAVKEKGKDTETNPKLRLILEKAKQCNLPKENIERAIKRGAGEILGEKLEQVFFEAYGPGGVALIIEGITDNKNRTLLEIKQALSRHNGKLVGPGSVVWMFKREIESDTNSLMWKAKEQINLEEKNKQACQELFKVLDENEAVQKIYSNLNFEIC